MSTTPAESSAHVPVVRSGISACGSRARFASRTNRSHGATSSNDSAYHLPLDKLKNWGIMFRKVEFTCPHLTSLLDPRQTSVSQPSSFRHPRLSSASCTSRTALHKIPGRKFTNPFVSDSLPPLLHPQKTQPLCNQPLPASLRKTGGYFLSPVVSARGFRSLVPRPHLLSLLPSAFTCFIPVSRLESAFTKIPGGGGSHVSEPFQISAAGV